MSYTAADTRYNNMKYRRCGRSGLKLPMVSLGLWHNFGDVDDFSNIRKLICASFDAGITHFDLANNYGPPPGSAEINFGKVLKHELKDHRDELIISSKAGYYMWPGPYGEWGSRKYLISSLDQSLTRMGLEYVDIFYSHRPDPDTPLEETMGALDSIVRQGKALYVGISNYRNPEARQAIKILKEMGTPCVIHQPRYSMFDRWVEESVLKTLGDEGVGCIPFSPLAQGLLTNRYLKGIPSDSRVQKGVGFLRQEHVTAEVLQKIAKLNEIAERRGQTLAQMALSWILKDERVTSVLIGVSKTEQLDDSIQCIHRTDFSPEELEAIELILEK